MAQTREICVASEEKKTDTLDVCRLEWTGHILRRSHRNFAERIFKFCLRQHGRTVWNRYSKYLSNGPSKRFFLFGKHVRIWVYGYRFCGLPVVNGRNIVDVAWRCGWHETNPIRSNVCIRYVHGTCPQAGWISKNCLFTRRVLYVYATRTRAHALLSKYIVS